MDAPGQVLHDADSQEMEVGDPSPHGAFPFSPHRSRLCDAVASLVFDVLRSKLLTLHHTASVGLIPPRDEPHYCGVIGIFDKGVAVVGTMVEDFRQDRTVNWESDWLKILVKTPTSWSAQSFSTRLQTPSGPATFRGLTACSVRLTSSTVRMVSLWAAGCGVAASGGLTSKWAKKWFSTSTSETSPSLVPKLVL